MVKWFQKIFLLLSGCLILAHGIIPHHHHEANTHECSKAKSTTAVFHQQSISESCACSLDHSSDADPACFGIGTSLLKAPHSLNAALPAASVELNIPVSDFFQEYGYLAAKDFFIFVSDKASRAPPVV
jgi:hypothetical protein